MKQTLLKEYEKRKQAFLEEKTHAEQELAFINNQMKTIELEMKHCANTIQQEKANIRYHQEHLSFKSPMEIEISLEAIKHTQETLLTLGEVAFSFQSNIITTLHKAKETEKGIQLCEDCLIKLQTLEPIKDATLLAEINEILQ